MHARADVIRDPRFQKTSYPVFPWMIFVLDETVLQYNIQWGVLSQYLVPLCLEGTGSEHRLSVSNLNLAAFLFETNLRQDT